MTASLVISQPMLMPWRGMFEQVKLCDQFVFYDDVQLPLGGGSGRGFITRVQIKTARGVDWLSLPVQRASHGKQLIKDSRFAHDAWRREHLGKIRQAYKAAPCFDVILESVVEPIYAFETENVSEFCINSMTVLWSAIGLSRPFQISSRLGISPELSASARVLEICRHFGATDYISGLGAMNYIDYPLFENAGIRINYMDYQSQPYPQLHGEFTPYVSLIDMLFNLGAEETAGRLVSRGVYWRDWPSMEAGRPVKRQVG